MKTKIPFYWIILFFAITNQLKAQICDNIQIETIPDYYICQGNNLEVDIKYLESSFLPDEISLLYMDANSNSILPNNNLNSIDLFSINFANLTLPGYYSIQFFIEPGTKCRSNIFYLTDIEEEIQIKVSGNSEIVTCRDNVFLETEIQADPTIINPNGDIFPEVMLSESSTSSFESSWSTDIGNIITNTEDAQIEINQTGTYNVTVTNSCATIDRSIEIKETTIEILSIEDETPDIICENDTYISTLSSSFSCKNCIGTISMEWLLGDSILMSETTTEWDESSNLENVNQSGTYTFVVNNSVTGCSDSLDVQVDIQSIAPPIAIITAVDGVEAITCANTSVTLNAENSIGSNLTYNWSTNLDGPTFASTPSYTSSNEGNIYLILDNNCSSDTASFNVEEDINSPIISFSENPITLCEEDFQIVSVQSTNSSNNSYLWDTGSTNSEEAFFLEGMHSITITNEDNACTSEGILEVIEGTLPDISMINTNYTVISENVFSIDDLPIPNEWELIASTNILGVPVGTEGSGNIQEILRLENSRATGLVEYLVTIFSSSNVCPIDVPLSIKVFPTDNKFIPAIYSPNGDGIDDTWDINFGDKSAEEYSVVVYNRAGGIVFESDSYTQPWDGSACTNGAYYYIISNNNDATDVCKGAVSIIGKQ